MEMNGKKNAESVSNYEMLKGSMEQIPRIMLHSQKKREKKNSTEKKVQKKKKNFIDPTVGKFA